jgi:translation initiation factor IF-3
LNERINNRIQAPELRVLDENGDNLGVMSTREALELARERDTDLVEVGPNAKPPIAKLINWGKYQYEQKKKAQKTKSGAKPTETKLIQIKVGTGENDLAMKAKTASKWLRDGHRVKVELFLRGRVKGMDETFLKERLDRVLHFVTEHYKIAEPHKRSPKGLAIVIEREKSTKQGSKEAAAPESSAEEAK